MYNGFLIHPADDVVTVSEEIPAGSCVTYPAADGDVEITALECIPKYHKIAVRDVKQGSPVLKYGEVIGHATKDIKRGEHVHVQNISDFVH